MTQPTPPQDAQPMTGGQPGSPPPPGRGGASLAAGVVLLLLAVLLFAGSRVVAAGQRHAYDPAATPPQTYQLTAGQTYQLSSARSVAELKQAGVLPNLACFIASGAGAPAPLTLASTTDDDRNLHVFATMVAPATGPARLSCTGIAAVFVDDADDAEPDRSALLVLLSIAAGLLGVIATCSGGYARGRSRQPAGRA
ncbi:MAG TPA: hypothetical protein VGB75_03465 [Jatrophihabitans sp.]|jgi:hypothetical protein|uniref:hypothetical protein n=1 Tax=Jatrophihabitans sp. TaxID=1932789 RepID=UPI002F0CF0E6